MAVQQSSLLPNPRQSSRAILENIAQAQEFLSRAFPRDCVGHEGILRDADGCHEAITAAVRHLLKAQRCLVETSWPVETNWPTGEPVPPLPAQKPEQPNARVVKNATDI